MNLAYRDVRHNLGRFILTCFGLSLLLGVVLSMVGIYRGLVDDALVLARTPDVQLWVVESDTRGPFAESSRIPGEAREAIARLYGVTAAGAVTYQTVELRHGGRELRLYVVGYELGRPGGPGRIAAGRPITRAHYELIADRRTGLRRGDRIPLGDNWFTVVGLTEDQVDSGGNPVAYMTLLDAQELQFELEGAVARNLAARGELPTTDTVNAVIANVAARVPVTDVAAAVERWKHLSALTQEQQENLLLESVVEKARRQIGLFTTILLVVSAVIIALIIYTMTMDKTREIATLKLLGAPDELVGDHRTGLVPGE
ncbi:MAG TPA: ABC transporter permease, partial [Solirubrobacterales bacterium]